jgi:hypothetical protein
MRETLESRASRRRASTTGREGAPANDDDDRAIGGETLTATWQLEVSGAVTPGDPATSTVLGSTRLASPAGVIGRHEGGASTATPPRRTSSSATDDDPNASAPKPESTSTRHPGDASRSHLYRTCQVHLGFRPDTRRTRRVSAVWRIDGARHSRVRSPNRLRPLPTSTGSTHEGHDHRGPPPAGLDAFTAPVPFHRSAGQAHPYPTNVTATTPGLPAKRVRPAGSTGLDAHAAIQSLLRIGKVLGVAFGTRLR